MDQAGEASLSTTRSGVQFGSRKEDSEVWDDFDEKVTPHEERVKFYMNVGNKHFSEDGRNAEIPVDLVIQDRAAMSTGKFKGGHDVIVLEMIKMLSAKLTLSFSSPSFLPTESISTATARPSLFSRLTATRPLSSSFSFSSLSGKFISSSK